MCRIQSLFLEGRQAAGTAKGVIDEPLELAVDGSELISGPFLQRLHRCRVYTENETLCLLLFRHDMSYLFIPVCSIRLYGTAPGL